MFRARLKSHLQGVLISMVVMWCAIGGAAAVIAQDETPSLFTLLSPDPVVPHGNRGAFDDRYTDPGAAVYNPQDGLFHMFRNGFRAWPGVVQIQHMTSPDAITWTADPAEPVIHTGDTPFPAATVLASSVLIEPDGTWVLYFYTLANLRPGIIASGSIGRATAADPAGPWTIDSQPVLTPGSTGEWDSGQVTAPCVLRNEDGSYTMFYAALSVDSPARRIGMATSMDGITWTKYNDPDTTAAPYADSDPVFAPLAEGDWDGADVTQPRVQWDSDHGYTMVYRGQADLRTPSMNIGLATSPDGLHWSPYANNPVLTLSEMPASQFWYTATAAREDTTYLFIEFAAPGNKTSIWATSVTGALPPDGH
ncbi:MAG: hypothetical protein U0670_21460 [Anaerolineae bacterium]